MGAKTPLSFEINEGQVDPSIDFIARAKGYDVALKPTEAVLSLHSKSTTPRDLHHDRDPAPAATTVRIRSVGANPHAWGVGEEELPGVANYLIGTDASKWHTGVRTYARAVFKDVYPGIDIAWHGTADGLEYDYIVAPGADTSVIRVGYEGARSVTRNADGSVEVHTREGVLTQRPPLV